MGKYMNIGDYVMDRYSNVGRIIMMDTPRDPDAVCVEWVKSPLRGEIPNAFVRRKYLTIITKEVAQVVIASWG